MRSPFVISGAGCCLVDEIHTGVDFSSPGFSRYRSKQNGDGGLHPGRLVFAGPFESFCGQSLEEALAEIVPAETEPARNIGGPSIVSLIRAAQLLSGTGAEIRFFGAVGDDQNGRFLREQVDRSPVKPERLKISRLSTPSTRVLSDPDFNEGRGERAFINEIGAAREMGPEDLTGEFYRSDLAVFGGTALVPDLHDALDRLLKNAKDHGAVTLVNTVYDFRSESARPGSRWQLGSGDGTYPLIDLLITDLEEALNLSGTTDIRSAGEFFRSRGVSAFLITAGTEDTLAWSGGGVFRPLSMRSFPVSDRIVRELEGFTGGDTTGCGDNFTGGVIASLARQLIAIDAPPDLEECTAWGTVSGGLSCFHLGGARIEKRPGELMEMIRPYLESYKEQRDG